MQQMRPGTMHAIRIALAALVVSFATVSAASAQVMVVSERDLQFGMLTPGAPTTVDAGDVTRSAQLRVIGRGRYQVTFQLPTALVSMSGAQIPLMFGPADGQLTLHNRVTTFDPNATLDFRVNPAQQEAQLNLGSQALPASGQAAGSYTATIVMMVIQTGN